MILLILGIALHGSSCRGGEGKSSALRVGYVRGEIYSLPFMVGRDKGFFSDEGLESMKEVALDSGVEIMGAFSAGQLDIGYVGIDTVVTFFARKMADVQIIAQVNSGGSCVVVRKELDIHNLSGLVGRGVAVPGMSTREGFLLEMACKKKGIDMGEIEIIIMKPTDMIAAMSSGQIDAFVAAEPIPCFAIREGFAKILFSSREVLKDLPHYVIVADLTFCMNHPRLVSRFISAHTSALSYIEEHQSEFRDIARIQTGYDEESLSIALKNIEFSGKLSSRSLKHYLDYLESSGVLAAGSADSVMQRLLNSEFLGEMKR